MDKGLVLRGNLLPCRYVLPLTTTRGLKSFFFVPDENLMGRSFYFTPAAVAQFILTADILYANVALEGSQNANCSHAAKAFPNQFCWKLN